MFFKFLLVVVAVTAAAPQTEGRLLDTLDQWNQTLHRLLEIYEITGNYLQEMSGIDIGQLIAEMATSEQLAIILLHFLDNYTDNMPQEYVCLMRMVVASDADTQEYVREFINEIANYVRLTRERDMKVEECDAIDTSGVLGTIAQQNCRLHVQQLEININYSYLRLSLMMVQMRDSWAEGLSCIRA